MIRQFSPPTSLPLCQEIEKRDFPHQKVSQRILERKRCWLSILHNHAKIDPKSWRLNFNHDVIEKEYLKRKENQRRKIRNSLATEGILSWPVIILIFSPPSLLKIQNSYSICCSRNFLWLSKTPKETVLTFGL